MPAVRRLKTQEDCRKALAQVYRQLEDETLDPARARVMIYCALSVSSVISGQPLEERIQKLETTVLQKRGAA